MTYEDLAKRAPFLLACLNETMRMYPPVTAIIALVRAFMLEYMSF